MTDIQLDFSDVLIKPRKSSITSRKDVSLEKTVTFRNGQTWTGIPIIGANMDGIGTIEMAREMQKLKCITTLTKFTTDIPDDLNPDYFTISSGISNSDYERLGMMLEKYPWIRFITIEVANGYLTSFVDFVKKVHTKYPDKIIIAGNVVDTNGALDLYDAGASVVRLGIGSGSVCTTRIQTGVGRPQLSTIVDTVTEIANRKRNCLAETIPFQIISDGGCTCPGDIAKAFAAGATFVMLGGMLAGTDEGGGTIIDRFKKTEWIDNNGNPVIEKEQFVQFYGMSSDTSMIAHDGEMAEYRSSEGRTVEIPYKGPVKNVMQNIFGGLRSACTYTGASNLDELSQYAEFYRVNNQFNKVFV